MTNMDGKYMWVRKLLKNMDEKQLTELFHDIDDIDALHRIYSCAYQLFIQSKLKPHEKPEDAEHKAQDDRDRAADINSTLAN